MKQQYQTRYELLHENYQKWLTGFTRHAVSWGVCHPNIYYFHNLTPGWVSFNGEKPEIAIVPQSLHRLIYGPDKRSSPSLDDDLVVNLCTSEHLLVHHPMLEGILLSECAGLLSTRNGMLRYMHTPETINALNHSLPPQQEAVSFQAEKRCS